MALVRTVQESGEIMLDSVIGRLGSEWEYLEKDADESAALWNDQSRATFEDQFWHEISQGMRSYLSELEYLLGTLSEIETQTR